MIFESSLEYHELSKEMFTILVNDNIKFYFMFDRHSLVTAHLPVEVKDSIFKPTKDHSIIKLEYERPINKQIMDLDSLLDKIESFGIESLTPEEKKFLDNFEK